MRAAPAENEEAPTRPLVWLEPRAGGTTIEITSRTQHGRLLMLPTADCKEIILGVIGRAQVLFPKVLIHAIQFLSNHYNLLITVPDALAMSSFMQHVNSNIARELGRLYGWPERFWGRRYRWIPVIGAEKEEERLEYLIAQGTKENLVASPLDWPGASSLRALLDGTELVGVWFDRTREYAARRGKKKVGKYEFATRHSITLSPLPSWRGLSEEERRVRVAAMVLRIEQQAAAMRAKTGKKPLGVRNILRQNPHDMPRSLVRTPAPFVHARGQARREYLDSYFAFVGAFYAAAERLKSGLLRAVDEFPPGCFLPRFPFRAGPAPDRAFGF